MSLDRLADNLVEMRALAEQIDHSANVLQAASKDLAKDEILERIDDLLSAIEAVERKIGHSSAKKVAEATSRLNAATRAVSRGWFGLSAAVGGLLGLVTTLAVGAWLVGGVERWSEARIREIAAQYGESTEACVGMIRENRLATAARDGHRYLIVRSAVPPVRRGAHWYFYFSEK